MGTSLLDRVTSAAGAAARRVSRASRRLRAGSSRSRQFLKPLIGRKRAEIGEEGDKERGGIFEGEGVWKKSILMGEKCQPLDFEGVIYYDADGRRVPEIPTSRSPLLTPLRGSSASSIAIADHNTTN